MRRVTTACAIATTLLATACGGQRTVQQVAAKPTAQELQVRGWRQNHRTDIPVAYQRHADSVLMSEIVRRKLGAKPRDLDGARAIVASGRTPGAYKDQYHNGDVSTWDPKRFVRLSGSPKKASAPAGAATSTGVPNATSVAQAKP